MKGIARRDLDKNNVDIPILIEEYAQNGSLENYIKHPQNDQIKITNSMKMIILYGIAQGMKDIHNREIIHGNLKPSNILLDENYYPLIDDIGPNKTRINQNELNINDFLYSAPEIVASRGQINYSLKSDVYSYGLIVYFILTGKNPYEEYPNINNRSFVSLVCGGERPRLQDNIPSYFKYLISLMWDKCMEKRPSFEDIVNLFDAGVVFPSIRCNSKEMKIYTGYAINVQDSFDINCIRSAKSHFTRTQNDELASVATFLLADVFDDTNSQKEIGKNYYYGTILEKDDTEAFKYLQKAAKKKDGEAVFYLGQCHLNGVGCKKDESKANKLFEQSSQLGCRIAESYLFHKNELNEINDEKEPVAIILGSYTVGKTTFVSKLINIYDARIHNQSIKPIDYKLAYIRGEQRISFRIRDTYGMERFKSFLPSYCRDVSLGIIMFDINSVATFNAIDEYIDFLF